MPDAIPTVSVGIPTYNRQGSLERAVRSVLAQDHRSLEVVVFRRLAELGRPIYYVPDAVMVHAGGVSSGQRAAALGEMLERHREEYARRTMGRLRATIAIAAMRIGRRVEPSATDCCGSRVPPSRSRRTC